MSINTPPFKTIIIGVWTAWRASSNDMPDNKGASSLIYTSFGSEQCSPGNAHFRSKNVEFGFIDGYLKYVLHVVYY